MPIRPHGRTRRWAGGPDYSAPPVIGGAGTGAGAMMGSANLGTVGATVGETANLIPRIRERCAGIAVLGQGYVGLSLACAAAGSGFSAVGIDVDEDRIGDLRAGALTVPGVSQRTFSDAMATGLMKFDVEAGSIARADVVVICVPTPMRDHTPDVSYIQAACTTIADHLTPGTLVILESTTYPGTTDDLVRPLLETSGLDAGSDFLLAYCPERIDPGDENFDFSNIARIAGGIDDKSVSAASIFYKQLVDEVVTVSSCRTAEMAKLLENTFRHVNIALVNEMAMLCRETDIDVWEVIEAAASKPFGFMPFYPGPGVGGHCIPLDPAYLAWQVRRDAGHQFRILEQSQDINAQMPGYVGARIGEVLNDLGKAVRGTPILILGVAYKPDVGDVRESPSLKVMDWLTRRGADVSFHDPFVESVWVGGRQSASTELSAEVIEQAGCVVLLTPHSTYDLEWIARHANTVFDARNAYGRNGHPNVIRL